MKSFKQFLLEKNWIKAYKVHNKIEKGRDNKLWKHRHLIGAVYGGVAALNATAGNKGSLAVGLVSAATVLGPHIVDIRNIRKKLNAADKQGKK